MRIELESHPGVVLKDPFVELKTTIDDEINQTFTPNIVFTDSVNPLIKIGHSLPAQPYVNGSWESEDVKKSIEDYIKLISKD